MTRQIDIPTSARLAASSVKGIAARVDTVLARPSVTPDSLAAARRDLDELIAKATALRKAIA